MDSNKPPKPRVIITENKNRTIHIKGAILRIEHIPEVHNNGKRKA